MPNHRNGKDERIMNIRITIDANINLDTADIEEMIQKELEESAYEIEKESKRLCPVDTGNLRSSIEATISDLEVDVGTDCEYAGFVHDGTYRMAARPFLDTAADTVLEDIEDRIADAIERSI